MAFKLFMATLQAKRAVSAASEVSRLDRRAQDLTEFGPRRRTVFEETSKRVFALLSMLLLFAGCSSERERDTKAARRVDSSVVEDAGVVDGDVESDSGGVDDAGVTPQPESAPFCSSSNWCAEQACPAPASFTAIWGTDPRSIFLGDDSGWIYHFDGERWQVVAQTERLNGFLGDYGLWTIWGRGENDVYAGGDGRAFHYDGTSWNRLPLESVSAFWGTASNNVYAASGWQIFRFDGSQWEVVFEDDTNNSRIEILWGSGPADIFAANSQGVYHYDGNAWGQIWDQRDVTAIWGSGPNNVFATLRYSTAIYRFDGTSWSIVAGPYDDGGFDNIWGSGPEDIYVVGRLRPTVHFDGSSWRELQNDEAPSNAWLAWGTSSDHVLMLGDSYRWFERFDGTTWHGCRSVFKGSSSADLNAIWGPSAGTFIVAGGTTAHHVAGSGWFGGDDSYQLFKAQGIWGESLSDFYAVGEGRYASPIQHFTGRLFGREVVSDGDFVGIWGTDSNNVYAVKQDMNVLHYDGTDWSPTGPLSVRLTGNGVWGSGPEDVYVVGGYSTFAQMIRYDGENWVEPLPGGASIAGSLAAVWGSGPSDVFAVGHGGDIIHYDGQTWRAMSSGTRTQLMAVWGSGSRDVYAAGLHGTLLHYDGGSWSTLDSGTHNDLYAIWGSGPDEVIVVGEDATVMSYRR